MITTGTIGHSHRLAIDPAGNLHSIDADGVVSATSDVLNWYIAADDRWHIPADETAVRQTRIEGTPVTETRVRVPNGDVVQRVASVADGGGITVIEIENESTLPVAIAFDRSDVLTERPIGNTPIQGIDLPAGSFVTPLGHAAVARIGLAHREPKPGPLPALPDIARIVRGWHEIVGRAGSLDAPDGLAEALTTARAELILEGVPAAEIDPVAFLLGIDQIVRMGVVRGADQLEPWLIDIVGAVQGLGRGESKVEPWLAVAALAGAQRVMVAADEPKAATDIAKISAAFAAQSPVIAPALNPAEVAVADAPATTVLAAIERSLAADDTVLPSGVPSTWFGQSVDCRGWPTVAGSTVSFALRWHGERPAVLWEQAGPNVELRAPAMDRQWRTAEQSGEALWQPVAVG